MIVQRNTHFRHDTGGWQAMVPGARTSRPPSSFRNTPGAFAMVDVCCSKEGSPRRRSALIDRLRRCPLKAVCRHLYASRGQPRRPYRKMYRAPCPRASAEARPSASSAPVRRPRCARRAAFWLAGPEIASSCQLMRYCRLTVAIAIAVEHTAETFIEQIAWRLRGSRPAPDGLMLVPVCTEAVV